MQTLPASSRRSSMTNMPSEADSVGVYLVAASTSAHTSLMPGAMAPDVEK